MNNEIRWKQRFQNFEKAYLLLNELMHEDRLFSKLEQAGIVQHFEILIELSWKTLKDYLEDKGYDAVQNGKKAIRKAFQDELISDAETRMEALKKRNLTSHTYNEALLEEIFLFIKNDFYPIVRDLYHSLKKEL